MKNHSILTSQLRKLGVHSHTVDEIRSLRLDVPGLETTDAGDAKYENFLPPLIFPTQSGATSLVEISLHLTEVDPKVDSPELQLLKSVKLSSEPSGFTPGEVISSFERWEDTGNGEGGWVRVRDDSFDLKHLRDAQYRYKIHIYLLRAGEDSISLVRRAELFASELTTGYRKMAATILFMLGDRQNPPKIHGPKTDSEGLHASLEDAHRLLCNFTDLEQDVREFWTEQAAQFPDFVNFPLHGWSQYVEKRKGGPSDALVSAFANRQEEVHRVPVQATLKKLFELSIFKGLA